jgi:hypothetical protein
MDKTITLNQMQMKLFEEFKNANDNLEKARADLEKVDVTERDAATYKAGQAFIAAHKAMQDAAVVFSYSVAEAVRS